MGAHRGANCRGRPHVALVPLPLRAIGTEREFNASTLILGRTLPGVANITDPARWQWFAGDTQAVTGLEPIWSG